MSRFALKNPHLDGADHLYHLGLTTSDNLESKFGDVKFVCTGGSASRMKKFAEYLYTLLGKPENTHFDTNSQELHNISGGAGRYVMYKVGPALILNHGIGMASLSVALNEVFKLLHYAKCKAGVKVIRMGSSGGLGVSPGTLVITKQPHDSTLAPEFKHVSLGRVLHDVCETCPNMREELLAVSKKCNIPAVIANTMSTDDFFEAQCRLDGAFCDYGEQDKMKFLRRAHDEFGIKNIEMESTCISAMCHKAGLSCAVVCVTFLNRLLGDTVDTSDEQHEEWQRQLFVVLGNYIRNTTVNN